MAAPRTGAAARPVGAKSQIGSGAEGGSGPSSRPHGHDHFYVVDLRLTEPDDPSHHRVPWLSGLVGGALKGQPTLT